MMKLLEISPEERAFLQSLEASGECSALADRLRQHLVASLGARVSVVCSPGAPSSSLRATDEPVIQIGPALAAAWLALRYGGGRESKFRPVRDAILLEPLLVLVRRALAQTVINIGEGGTWPQALHLQVDLGRQHGGVEIFWRGANAMAWARRVLGGRQ